MCVFSAASPPKKHTLVLFEAASGGLKKNKGVFHFLFCAHYLKSKSDEKTEKKFHSKTQGKSYV